MADMGIAVRCLFEKYAFAEISIDMINQYLMRQITVACAAGDLQARPGTDEFYTLPSHKNKLLTMRCPSPQ